MRTRLIAAVGLLLSLAACGHSGPTFHGRYGSDAFYIEAAREVRHACPDQPGDPVQDGQTDAYIGRTTVITFKSGARALWLDAGPMTATQYQDQPAHWVVKCSG